MRLLEIASLLSLGFALLSLALRGTSVRLRCALFGSTAGLMGLQALMEGARWQLVPAYVFAAIGVALLLRRSMGPRAGGMLWGAVRVALAAIALFAAVLLPLLLPVPSFSPPQGPYPVGTVTFMLQDPAREDPEEPGRSRRLMVQVWYPADASAARSPRARYLPDVLRTGPALCRSFGLPPFFANHLAYASSHSHENVPFSSAVGRAPLLVFSHGFRFTHSVSTTTAEALASQGYVVAALEHTYDAAAVAFPDGTVALTRVRMPRNATADEQEQIKTSWVQIRAADVRFVLDTLASATGAPIPEVLIGHTDMARVGVFGHSLGGSTAIEVCRTDARFVACADLDGSAYGEAKASGLDQPFLLIGSKERERVMADFVGHLRGPSCRIAIAGVGHMDFTDVPALVPFLRYIDPRLKSAAGDDTLRETNRLVTAFFDATLRSDETGWSRARAPRPRLSIACDRLPAVH